MATLHGLIAALEKAITEDDQATIKTILREAIPEFHCGNDASAKGGTLEQVESA